MRDTRSDWKLPDRFEGVELRVGSKSDRSAPWIREFPLRESIVDCPWEAVLRIAMAWAGVRSRSGGRLARFSDDAKPSLSIVDSAGGTSPSWFPRVTSFDLVGVSGAELLGVGLWPLIVEAGENVCVSSKGGSGHWNSLWTSLRVVTKSSILAARNLQGEKVWLHIQYTLTNQNTLPHSQ